MIMNNIKNVVTGSESKNVVKKINKNEKHIILHF